MATLAIMATAVVDNIQSPEGVHGFDLRMHSRERNSLGGNGGIAGSCNLRGGLEEEVRAKGLLRPKLDRLPKTADHDGDARHHGDGRGKRHDEN